MGSHPRPWPIAWSLCHPRRQRGYVCPHNLPFAPIMMVARMVSVDSWPLTIVCILPHSRQSRVIGSSLRAHSAAAASMHVCPLHYCAFAARARMTNCSDGLSPMGSPSAFCCSYFPRRGRTSGTPTRGWASIALPRTESASFRTRTPHLRQPPRISLRLTLRQTNRPQTWPPPGQSYVYSLCFSMLRAG